MELKIVEKLIETLAHLRGVAVAEIKAELTSGEKATHDELFKLACAFKAVA